MHLLRESGYPVVPWKNGGGVTREIHREPADPTPFDWRLSLATIDRPGPFSHFAGYHRTLVLVRGAGVELSFGGHGSSRLSSVGQTACFDGAWQTSCTLLQGPSTDLNLIVSQQRAESTSRSVQLLTAESVPTAGWRETFVCCLDGSVQITNTSGTTEMLAAVDVARCVESDGTITCRPVGPSPARIFLASVRSRAALRF